MPATVTLSIAPRRERNPLVAPALMRRAGAHRRCRSGERQRAARELRAELRRDP